MKQYSGFALCVVLSTVLAAVAGAQPAASITVAIGDAVGNVGGSVEVPVYLTSGSAQPTVLIIFIRYDPDKLVPFPDYYEFVLTDALGNPVLDEEGNTVTVESAVRPEPALEAADKIVETGVLPDGVQTGALPPGVFSIGIFGFDVAQQPIPEGKVLTVGFKVLSGAAANETLLVEGVGTDDPVQVTGENNQGEPIVREASSSAADGDANRVEVNLADGMVVLGCAPPATPGDVQASQDRQDAVEVTWSPIAGQDIEYRVYRSTLADANTAVPLGAQWQSETSFLDITAAAPLRLGSGCAPSDTVITQYYYWVKARTSGCESAFQSVGTLGFRTDAKSFHAAGVPSGAGLRGTAALALLLHLVLAVWRRTPSAG